MALEITDKNIDEILEGNNLVLVDFWAPWCGPCRIIGPLIDELASQNPDIKIGKLNVDMNSQSTVKYGIVGIPALLFFKEGKLVESLRGIQSKSALQKIIDTLKK
jgi:thioredoxin 1